MKLLNFIILKLTLCLITGIVIGHYVNPSFNVTIYASICLVVVIAIYAFILKQRFNRSPYFGILSYLCMIAIGANAYNIQDETLEPQHYSNFNLHKSPKLMTFEIKERLKPDAYNDKYIASLVAVENKAVYGTLLVNIKRDSAKNHIPIDAVLTTSTELASIQKPLNPHQFDYRKYLELKQIYHQIYLKQDNLLLLSKQPTSIYGYADRLRTKINKKLIAAGFKNEALSIINALLLGQRQSIDKNTYNNYVNSGTIHILAVSGLHVGILLLILNFIFKPLLYLKHGRILRPFIIVALLWSFAVIAGLSPSVTRAVTMFSVISVAMHLKRPTNIYNTLAISAFFILLFKPTFLFEVGFQMSYLAVLGIVSVQPILYKLWQPKYWIVDKPWQIFTVTIAAQFGVVPISLFYFHQFPGLFFISNLVVIPFLGLILGFGLLVIVLALFNGLPTVFVSIYSTIINSLNTFIAWVAQFEDFLLRDIPFTLIQVIFSYFVIVAMVQIYKHKTFKWVIICLLGIICFQGTFFYTKFTNHNTSFVVFNKSRFSVIGQKQNDKLIIHHNLDSTKQTTDNVIRNYKVGEMVNTVKMERLQNLYHFNDKTILIIDSLGVYNGISFKPNYILLRDSPKINLNRAIDNLNPQHIIADASNFKTYVKRWQATCRNKKIPFHYTNEKGAYILK